MNSSRLSRCLLTLLAALGASVLPAKDVEEVNFLRMERNPDGSYERTFEYAYGDWGNNRAVQVQGKGLLVNLAGSKGGIGENRGLDFRKHTKARIDFIIGNRNRATSFVFTLEDKDGTNQSYDISLQDKPKGAPLSAVIDLTTPARVNQPGGKPGLDLKRLRMWQLAGNWQDLPVEILFLKIWAVD